MSNAHEIAKEAAREAFRVAERIAKDLWPDDTEKTRAELLTMMLVGEIIRHLIEQLLRDNVSDAEAVETLLQARDGFKIARINLPGNPTEPVIHTYDSSGEGSN